MTDPTPQTTPTRDEAVPVDAERFIASFTPKTPRDAMAMTLFKAWVKADPTSGVAQHPASYLANFVDMADAALASAPAPASGGVDAVAVKALEWQADPFSEALIADTNGLGRYVVVPYEGQFKVTGGNVRSLKPTVEAAQIKAQADYEHRIRSALSPAATSGRVDAVAVKRKLLLEWAEDFDEASKKFERLEKCVLRTRAQECRDLAASLSPAATPVSEAGPVALPDDRELPPMTERGLAGQLMDAAWPHYGGNNQPSDFWNDFGEGIRFALHYLAKPASSPAGGDVVEQVAAIIDPEIWAIEQPVPTRAHVEDFHQRRRSSCELAQRIIAALSQSTSAGRVGE